MTVYCPNCGKPNTNEAQSCASCGTELKKQKSAGSKFKGTMMMTNPTAGPPPAAAPPAAAPPAAAPPAAAPPGGPVQAGAPKKKKDMAFQATMLGPMSPPPGAAPGATPGGFGAPPAAAPAPAPAGFGAPPAAAPAPAPAGFGAPPAAAPAAGGFGAPTPAPAAGGFGGATPAPAAGGFGAPTPAPAAGGFGGATPAPAGGFGAATPAPGFGAAPAGGFGGAGAPAQGAPAPGAPAPAGGFGAAGGGAPPASGGGAPAGGGSGKKKIIIGVGVGCLFFLLIACGLGAYACNKAKQAAQGAGADIAAELQRFSLGLTLSSVQASCRVDPSGAGTAPSFHAQVFPQLQASACQVNDNTIDAFGDGTRSEAHGVAGTDTEDLATSLGGEINKCYVYTSGSAKVAGCIFPDGFKIIALENPAGVR